VVLRSWHWARVSGERLSWFCEAASSGAARLPEQLASWQPLFDNARKLRDLLAELQELTLAIIEDSPARNHD
jgi:hypothetical protein